MQCYLSVEDTGEVSLAPRPQLTCGQTSLEVGDVTLKVDQGLVVLLYVGLRAVGMVVVLSWPAVPHDHVKNCLAMMKLILFASFLGSRWVQMYKFAFHVEKDHNINYLMG